MKWFNVIFVILFIISAVLQYNDPDPFWWMALYLFAAVLCVLAVKGHFPAPVYYIAFLIYGIYAIVKFTEENGVWDWITRYGAENIAATMQAEKPWIEDAREFFGLLIMMSVLAINFFIFKKRKAV